MFLTAILDYAQTIMLARLDFSTFLICWSEDLSDNESDEKPVAICGGSICILTGLCFVDSTESNTSVSLQDGATYQTCCKKPRSPASTMMNAARYGHTD